MSKGNFCSASENLKHIFSVKWNVKYKRHQIMEITVLQANVKSTILNTIVVIPQGH